MMNANKFLLGVFTLGAIVSMVSCDKGDTVDPVDATTSQIRLGASITETKAPVDSIGDPDFGAVGVYGIRGNVWVANPWIDNDSSIVDLVGDVNFTDTYFYPAEGDTVDFYAYHPYTPIGTSGIRYVTAPSTGTAPVLNFTITGQEDIMYATPVFGSKTSTLPNALNFNHALTQLKFKAKTGTEFPSSVAITNIIFNGVNTKSSMNIANGTLSAWTTPSDTLTSGILNSGAISTTATATDVGAPIMLQPGLSSFSVDFVTTFGTFSNIDIIPTGGDGTFLAGKAYTVELTFTATGIELSATVSAWANTGTGTGDVE